MSDSCTSSESFTYNWSRLQANENLFNACKSGNKDAAIMAIEWGATNFEKGLEYACRKGHKKLAEFMIEKGACNFEEGLIIACKYNQKEITLFMIEKGAIELHMGLDGAISGKNIEMANFIVELMLEKGVKTDVIDLIWACYKNDRTSVEKLIKKDITIRSSFMIACKHKYNDLALLILKEEFDPDNIYPDDIDHLTDAMIIAYKYHCYDLAFYLIELGASIDAINLTAIEIIYLMLKGVTNLGRHTHRGLLLQSYSNVYKNGLSIKLVDDLVKTINKY